MGTMEENILKIKAFNQQMKKDTPPEQLPVLVIAAVGLRIAEALETLVARTPTTHDRIQEQLLSSFAINAGINPTAENAEEMTKKLQMFVSAAREAAKLADHDEEERRLKLG